MGRRKGIPSENKGHYSDAAQEAFASVLKQQGRTCLGAWQGCRKPLRIMCQAGHIVEQAPYSVTHHSRCCKLCSTYGRRRQAHEVALQKVSAVHPELLFHDFVYIKASKKVVATCKEHGDFEVLYSNLFAGQGCPRCNKHWDGDNHLVYVLVDTLTHRVKIGKTKNLKQRLYQLKKYTPNLIVKAKMLFGDGSSCAARKAEKAAHSHFIKHNTKDKGYTGATEFFWVTPESAIEYLQSIGGKLTE